MRNRRLEEAVQSARRHLTLALKAMDSVTGSRKGLVDPDEATMQAKVEAERSKGVGRRRQ